MLIGVVAIWEALAAMEVYNTVLLPPPSQALTALQNLWRDGTLATDLAASMKRYVPGFLAGSLIGVVAGILTGVFKSANRTISPLFNYFRAIPPVALVPFALVLFGIGDTGRISLIAWASIFPAWLNTHAGIQQIPIEYLRAAKVFRASWSIRVLEVWLPCAAPYVLSGLRIAVATSWFALAASEMFAASSGIAFRIIYSHQLFQTDAMVGMILLLGAIALLTDGLVVAVKRYAVQWSVGR